MLDTRIHLIVVDAVMTVARTIDTAFETGSIQNARQALIEGRRNQVIRSLLEEEDTLSPDEPGGARETVRLSPAASR